MTLRAEAFTQAREGKAEAIPGLLALAASTSEPPLVRANALGHLGRFRDARAAEALRAGLASSEPAMRAVSAMNLEASGDERSRTALVAALGDTRRVVRAAAAVSLMRARA